MVGFIKTGAKITKKIRKTRKTKKGRPTIAPHIKQQAKAAGFSSVKKWKEAGSPKPKSKKKSGEKSSKKSPGKGTKKERQARAQIAKLTREQRRDMKGDQYPSPSSTMRRTMVPAPGLYPPPGSSVAGQSVEAGFPRSKTPPPLNQSPKQKRRRTMAGLQGINKRGSPLDIGTWAEPRSNVAREMGLLGRGKAPSEDELKAMGGFEIRKKGGKVGRGSGKALRGVGCVRKR